MLWWTRWRPRGCLGFWANVEGPRIRVQGLGGGVRFRVSSFRFRVEDIEVLLSRDILPP